VILGDVDGIAIGSGRLPRMDKVMGISALLLCLLRA